jgi:hypothetical protein
MLQTNICLEHAVGSGSNELLVELGIMVMHRAHVHVIVLCGESFASGCGNCHCGCAK